MGDPTPQRGGRPKRMVRITPKGAQAASAFYHAVDAGEPWRRLGGDEMRCRR